MTNIVVTIRDGEATAKLTGILTTGMVGVPVIFDLGPEWEDLTIIAVIQGNGLTFDRPLLGTRQTTVPYEVLEKVGEHIYIGAEGCSASGDLVIQSNMAVVDGTVRQGADPSGDIAIDPTQPIWAELMHEVEDLRENTVDPETLMQHDMDSQAHAPLREVLQSLEARKLNVSNIADDLYSKSSDMALSANMGSVLREKIDNDILAAQKALEAEIERLDSNCVKSVNGVLPDENGDVVVEGGGSESGEDGFSPVANVTQTATGTVISITDKSGTTTATVTNGKDGADGKTPVKGVDYFTEADKQEIAEQAAGMVEVPEGGSGNLKWKQVFDFTVEEEVTSLTISVKEIIEQLKNAPFMRIEFYAAPVSGADVLSATTGKGTLKFQSGAAGAEIWITDGVFLPGHVQGTAGGTVSGDFSIFRQGAIGGVNTTTIRMHQANRNFSYKYNQVCNLNIMAGDVDHRFTISTTESAIGAGSTFKIFII